MSASGVSGFAASPIPWSGSMVERPTIEIPDPPGGWLPPWANVAEIEAVLPHENWTLVGGLMTQLHCIRGRFAVIRPTSDVDIVLHVETTRGVAAAAATALESLGYELTPSTHPRGESAHRFRRGKATIDLPSSPPDIIDTVDELVADHASPRVAEKLRGQTMVAIE